MGGLFFRVLTVNMRHVSLPMQTSLLECSYPAALEVMVYYAKWTERAEY